MFQLRDFLPDVVVATMPRLELGPGQAYGQASAMHPAMDRMVPMKIQKSSKIIKNPEIAKSLAEKLEDPVHRGACRCAEPSEPS